MNWRRTKAFFVAVAAWLASTGSGSAADFSDLLQRIPDRANALLLLDVQGILKSPLATEENWGEKLETDYVGGITRLPPTAVRLLLGAQMDFQTLNPAWEIGLLERSDAVSMAQLAKGVSGTLDKIGDERVVVGPRNACYVQFGPKLLAMYRPANRQELARWLRFTRDNRQVRVADYLKAAANETRLRSQVVLAVDLANMVDAGGIAKRLQVSPALSAKSVDLNALANTIAGIQGATLSIRIDNDISGELRLDFEGPVEALAPYGKALILESLNRMGAPIQEMDDWKVETGSKSIALRGKLSKDSVKLILTPVLSPEAFGPAGGQGEDSRLVATQKYYKSILQLVEELKKQRVTEKQNQGYWFDQYGKKIDDLPILNVDEEMLQFGAAVAALFHNVASIYRSGKSTLNALEVTKGSYNVRTQNYAPGGYGGYGNGYGGYGWGYSYQDIVNVSNVSENSMTQAQLVAQARLAKKQMWPQIEQAATAIRKRMTLKYGVEF